MKLNGRGRRLADTKQSTGDEEVDLKLKGVDMMTEA